MNQPKELTFKIGKSTIVVDDLDRLYDCGIDFNLKLSGADVFRILTNNIDIVGQIVALGEVETEIGDRFFEALVKDATGYDWDLIKKLHGNEAYKFVELQALKKGYKSI